MIVAAMLLMSGQAAVLAKPNDDQRIKCHVEETTGTLVGRRRICHTNAEWRQQAEASSAAVRDLQDRSLIQPTHGS